MAVSGTYTNESVADRSLIEERVRLIFERRAVGDLSGMMELVAPDILYRGAIQNSRGIVRRGKESFAELARAFDVFYETLSHEIGDLVIDGNRAALRRTLQMQNRGTGKIGVVDIWAFLTFRDGLLVEMTEHSDTQAIAELGGWP